MPRLYIRLMSFTQPQPAPQPPRATLRHALRFLLCATPALLTLFFIPGLESSFLTPKRALLVTLATALAAFGIAHLWSHSDSALSFRARFTTPRIVLWLAAALCAIALLSWLLSPRRDL